MGPIDYTINVQNPIQAALQGYQGGAAIRQDQQQQAAQEQALKQQQALQAAREQVFANPTAENFSRLMVLDPKSSEAYQRTWTTLNTKQQQSMASDLLQWGAAIKSGKPEVASEALTRRADLLEQQSGGQPTPESQALRVQARLAVDHPEFALGQIQALLAANPNGKDAAETLSKFGTEQRAAEQAPGQLRKVNADADKAVADASKAAVDAKYAEQGALLDLQKKGWDIKKITADIEISREANRIAAMNAATARAGNDLRRQELKVREARAALDEKIRDRAATVESAATTIDNFLNTADRILAAGLGKDGKPNSTLRAATGPIDSRLPTMQTDVANIEALVETLGSQAFLSQIPALKGMGQLSDAEGKKVQAALTNLSLSQGADQLVANVKEAQRLILKARKNIETRHGVPAGVPDTPAVQTPAADIDALVKKYGG